MPQESDRPRQQNDERRNSTRRRDNQRPRRRWGSKVKGEGAPAAKPAEEAEQPIHKLAKSIFAATPANTKGLTTVLNEPKYTFLALPLWKFSSSGSVSRAIARLDDEQLEALYTGTLEARQQVNDEAKGDEAMLAAADRLEMGRRALTEVMAERVLKTPEELAADDQAFTSKEARSLPGPYQRDPGLYIAKGEHAKRRAFLDDQQISILERFFNKPRSISTKEVIDGDGIKINGRINARLFGIDAPEMDALGGPEAKAHLEKLVEGKALSASMHGKCKHGRPIIRLYAEGKDICRQMVHDGMAVAYTRYSKRYLFTGMAAQFNKRGLWKENLLQKPEDYRREKAEREAAAER